MTRLTERLRRHALKATRPRCAVLEALCQLNRPAMIREVFAIIPRGDCDLASVYRAVRALASAGLVKRIDFGEGAARFELLREGDHGHHHHLVCTRCASVVELDECLLGKIESAVAARNGFRAVSHRLEFFGICPTCQ